MTTAISELGEKKIISSIIRPLLNPGNDVDSIGDDAAIVKLEDGTAVCISTDRVPADLICFRLGLVDYLGLGYYLGVLNLSDIAAMGADPDGLLLNLGVPGDLAISALEALLRGAQRACSDFGGAILGGDMSWSADISISATSIGRTSYKKLLRRSGAEVGDLIYCSGVVGLTATAFHYFLEAKKAGLQLAEDQEAILADQFRRPAARFDVARALRDSGFRITCMDNTDGAGQTLLELAELNRLSYVIDEPALPIHEVTFRVAEHLKRDPVTVALSAGADFNLYGTVPEAADSLIETMNDTRIIGTVSSGHGLALRNHLGVSSIEVPGWNYFLSKPS